MSIHAPVKELIKTQSGRQYLDKMRERYRFDLLQPKDPLFNKVYGNQIKQQNNNNIKQQELAKAEWEKKNWGNGKSKYF